MSILTSETFDLGPPYLSGWIDHTVDANTRLSIDGGNRLKIQIEPTDYAFLGHRSEIRYNSNLLHGGEHRYTWDFEIPTGYIDNDSSLFTIMGQIHDNSLTNSAVVTFRHSHDTLTVIEALFPAHVAAWKLLPEWSQILEGDNTLSVLQMWAIDHTLAEPDDSLVGMVPVIKGNTFNMKLEIGGATDATGYLKWWHDGDSIVDISNIQTLYPASDDYQGGDNPHRFTVGIYQHTSVENSNHVFIDNIKIETGINTMAAITYEETISNGSQVDYNIICPFLDRDHIYVKLNGVETSEYTFLSDFQIRLNSAAANAVVVRVGRSTPKTVLTDFPSSNLTEADLDNGYLHQLYMAQELQDTFDEAIAGTLTVTTLPVGNFNAIVAPGVTDDSDSSYSVGSPWVDITADKSYICVDATVGAAVWIETSAGAGGGDSWGDAVDADIVPDGDGTRDLGATATRFAETYTDALDVTNNITVGGTVDGIDIATDVAANTAKVTNATHTGDVTGSGVLTIGNDKVVTAHILDGNVTLAKQADMATASLIGRNTAGTGVPEVLSKATALSLLNVEDGADVTDTTNVTAAGALMDSELTAIAAVKGLEENFTTTLKNKLDAIEASADVTDTANVTSAGALMDSEVDANIKTLALPANTTISAFGATVVDDANAAAARTTLGVDAAGTDNSTDVTLAGTPDYITLSGQVLTRNAIDLAADVTGVLPTANIADEAVTLAKIAHMTTASLLGRNTAATGDVEVLSKATALSLLNVEDGADVTDTTNVTSAGALMDSEVDANIKTLVLPASTTISAFGATVVDDANAAAARTTLDVDQAGTDNSTDVTLAGTPDYITLSGQVLTRNAVDLAADVTGVLPTANIADEAVTNAKLAHVATDTFKGRTTAATGDVEDLTLAQARTMIGQPVIQFVKTATSASSTTTEIIPVDDTIPDQSVPEGADVGLSVTITPKSTSSRLVIEWDVMVSNDTVGAAIMGVLYQDSTASALAASSVFPASSGLLDHLRGSYEMAAGTTSATTFKLWLGGSQASTTRTNGVSGRLFGAVDKSNIRVTEYAV